MEVLVMVAQLTLSLSILVVLHELGHFLPARWFGCRVEKFYLFFDPWFSLFKRKIGETEWGIGWVPLGGYVKISGMVDESMDMEQLAGPAQPYEFRAKPAWQRLIIMLGGVTVNFILGFVIFAGMLWYWGTAVIRVADVPDGIYAEPLGELYGLRTGDRLVRVGGHPIDNFDENAVRAEVLFKAARTIEVERDGRPITIALPDSLQRNLGKEAYKDQHLFSLPLRPVADYVLEGSPADSAGLRVGDRLLAIDGRAVPFQQDVQRLTRTLAPRQAVTLRVLRGSDTLDLPLRLSAERQIGFAPAAAKQYAVTTREYSIAEAIPAGIESGLDKLAKQGQAVGQMFRRNIDAGDSVGSFISIGKAYGGTWEWERFWGLTGLLSLILAVMNILPIPVLDGGHVMFLLYEVVTGRKPSDKFLQYATTIGFGLVMLLMVFALYNDFRKL